MKLISTRFSPFLPPSSSALSNPSRRSLIPIMAFSSSSSTPGTSSSPIKPNVNEREDEEERKLRLVMRYHNQTKHNFTSYARGPHGLDWKNQPDPFRRYVNAPLLPLHHFPDDNQELQDSPLYSSLFLSLPPPQPLSLATISKLFYDSLALSAWKSTGLSTWSLRVNPSSGNLHPTEAYLIAPPVNAVSESAFVAHYAPKEHSLEVRANLPSEFFPKFFPHNSFLIGISSIFWREAWKYGERAFRYCNHDVGHAIGAVSMAAAELGWDVKLLDGLGFEELQRLMGLHVFPEFQIPSRPCTGRYPGMEFEHPDCVLLVFPNGITDFDVNYKELRSVIGQFPSLKWRGKPNGLSKEHACWDIIYKTAEAVIKPCSVSESLSVDSFRSSGSLSQASYEKLSMRQVARKRRSAVDMDRVTFIQRSVFYQMLLHCLPSGSEKGDEQRRQLALPFRVLPWDAEIHLALFVHRVSDLPKGLYFLVRNEDHMRDLKKSMRADFKWSKPDGCPDDLPLYELALGDCQILAKGLSCHQDIGSDGCFSLGMISRFEAALGDKSAWMYPRLFWESGLVGQILYLEAHAMGISATGIGCYFDDPVHECLGIKDAAFQSLYHFTVGGPVLDKRIMSLPAYQGPTLHA